VLKLAQGFAMGIRCESVNSPLIDKYSLNQNLGFCDIVIDSISGNKRKSLSAIDRYEKQEISKTQLDKELKRRYNARKESGELITDAITNVAAFSVFKSLDKFTPVVKLFKESTGKKYRAAAIIVSVATGALVKPLLSKFDELGSGHDARKKSSGFLVQAGRGAVNGLASPILATSKLILTVPALLGINTGTRYLTGKNDKTFREYFETQKDSLAIHVLTTVPTLAFIGNRGKGIMKSWEDACKKARQNNESLKAFKNPYQNKLDLEQISSMMDETTKQEYFDKLLPIFFNPSEDKIIDSNIFIAKWLQTVPDKKIDEITEINGIPIPENLKKVIKNLKGACPPSYTPSEAQAKITAVYGNKYTIIKDEPLGVGTIAETYLAKNNETGQEVVIKFLKKNISKEKIEADKQEAQTLLEKSTVIKNKEEYAYYKKIIDVLYEAWGRETDLSLEKDAAEIMAKNAQKFNVVKPIEIKDNIYVMEKAKGVQLNRLDEELQRRNMTLTEDQVKNLLMNYNKVFIEQLIAIPRDGQKIIQADPNSANIFIDLDNLEKPITFLDLGNVLRYDNLTATRNALGHLDYIFGNSRGIARTNLDGAILPEGVTKENAIERLAHELDTHIYNSKTKIPPPNTINEFCIQVMKGMRIIPNADNANLIKAETTYFSNIFELKNKIQAGLIQEISKDSDFGAKLKIMLKEMKETGDFQAIVRAIITEIFGSIKRASFPTQKHAYSELKERLQYIEENKESALTTFYSLLN